MVYQSPAEAQPKGTIDRAFHVLKCFTPDDVAGLGVTELSRRAGLSKSTTHRLLASLVKNSAVVKAGDVYRLGPLFSQADSSTVTRHGEKVSEILTPFLSALFERTRCTVHLGYLVGTDVTYANKLFSFRGVEAPSRIGGRVPGYCTGVGKAILAWDENLVEASINRGLSPWTEHTITNPDELRQVLRQVRQDGIAYDDEEIMPGLSCVAAPVFGQGPVPVAAMSVSGPTESFTSADHIPTLRKITQAASKAYLRAVHDQEFMASRKWIDEVNSESD